jgi:hypothetical protein
MYLCVILYVTCLFALSRRGSVQLPGDDPTVDVPAGAGDGQHVHREAVGAGPRCDPHDDGAAAGGWRAARRRQCKFRRRRGMETIACSPFLSIFGYPPAVLRKSSLHYVYLDAVSTLGNIYLPLR